MASVDLYADELYRQLAVIPGSDIPLLDAVCAILATIADIKTTQYDCFFVDCVTDLASHDFPLTAWSQQHIARRSTRRILPDLR